MSEAELEANQRSLHDLSQSLLGELHRLKEMVEASAIDSSTSPLAQVNQRVAELQRNFQKIVARLAETDIDPAVEQRLRPYQTEAHRLLRLLGVEAMKLRAAKQPETIEKGRSQFTDQLDKLQPFLQVIADETSGLS